MSSKISSLASDTVVYGVSTVLARFLTFLLTPLFSNYLSKAEIGEVSGIYAMIAFVNIVYSLGMEPAFMRFWEKSDEQTNARVFRVAFLTVTLLGVAVTGITMLFASPIADSTVLRLGENGAHLVIIASMIPLLDALVLIPFARLRMQQRPRVFAALRLLSVVVTFVSTLILVAVLQWRIEGALWAGVIGSTTTFLVFIPSTLRTLGSHVQERGSWKPLLKEMLSFGLPTVPSNFSSIMVQVADRPIMLMLTSASVVGMYQMNFRLAIPMMMFVTVFEYAWKPFYLNHRDDPDAKQTFARVFTVFTAVCGAIFLVTAFFMENIVAMPFVGGRFVNPDYWEGMTIIPVIMFAYYFNGVFINMAAGLHIEKRTGFFPFATGVAAAVSVGATWLLVPHYGIMGAAWAKVLAYVVSAVLLYGISQRIYPVKYEWGKVVGIIVICALLYGGTFVLTTTAADSSQRLFYKAGVRIACLVVYLVAALLISNGGVRNVKRLVRL